MKRVLSVIMIISLVFCFAACKDKKAEKKQEETVDLEYFVRLGKIPESDYALGTKGEEIKKNAGVTEDEGFRFICLAYNNSNYYYEKENETDAITHVVSFNGAYGFPIGTTSAEIKAELKKGDLTAEEQELTEDEVFFIPVAGKFTGIKYTFGEHTACFVFKNGALCACTVY